MQQVIRTFNIKGKKNLQEAIKMAKKEIKEWNKFLKLTEKELEKYTTKKIYLEIEKNDYKGFLMSKGK